MRCNVTIVSILLRKEANPYTRNMVRRCRVGRLFCSVSTIVHRTTLQSNTTPLKWVHENLKRPGVPDILGLLEENIRRLQEGNEVDDLRS